MGIDFFVYICYNNCNPIVNNCQVFLTNLLLTIFNVMYNRIKEYVDQAFSGLPDNDNVRTTKKAFAINLNFRYQKYLRSGIPSEEAFNLAILNSQDIFHAVEDLKRMFFDDSEVTNNINKESNAQTAADTNNNSDNFDSQNQTFEQKTSDKKDFNSFNKVNSYYSSEKTKRGLSIFSSIFWPLVLAAYFLYSFLVKDVWQYSWIIFIVAGAIHAIINSIFTKTLEAKKFAISCVVWLIASALFLILSFKTGLWQFTWLIFVLAGAVQNILGAVFAKGEYRKVRNCIIGATWLIIITAYFAISFFTSRWDITWVTFLIGIAITQLVKLIVDKILLKTK